MDGLAGGAEQRSSAMAAGFLATLAGNARWATLMGRAQGHPETPPVRAGQCVSTMALPCGVPTLVRFRLCRRRGGLRLLIKTLAQQFSRVSMSGQMTDVSAAVDDQGARAELRRRKQGGAT